MKKAIAVLAALLCLVLAVSGLAESVSGSAIGMMGPVSVTLPLDGDTLTQVELDVSGETPEIGGAAAEALTAQILAAQSGDIDGVAGATVTSKAVAAAVKDALAKAQGAPAAPMTAGTYTAVAHGAKHDIKVEVTLSESAIEQIRVVEANDSPYISEAAISTMPQRILAAQSVAVDAVTGATLTSGAIRSAVADCLVQAGANLADFAAVPEITAGEDVSVDVLVVGGGTSGLTAALAAKTDSMLSKVNSGLDVLVVESNGYAGGNLAICGGYIASYFGTSLNEFTGNTWMPDDLVDSLLNLYPQYADVLDGELMRTLAGKTADTLNGLMARGFYLRGDDAYEGASYRLVPGEVGKYTSSTVVADPLTGERSNDHGYDIYGGGAFFARTLTQIVDDAGVDIRYETTATSLIMDGDACVGVTVKDHEKQYNIYAKKVVLATGYAGFDPDTIALYLPAVYGNTVAAETHANQSFAQKQITALGGQINDVHDPISDGHIILGYNSTLAHFGAERQLYNNMNGMLVSTEGVRFADDSDRGHGTAMKVLELGGHCYMIFDDAHEGVQFVPFLAENGLAWTDDTLEGLAARIGVPADAFAATVAKYNEDAAAGQDTAFGTPAEKMSPVLQAPYHAVRVNAISTGGIDIAVFVDGSMNVTLTRGGQPIENLYACGGAGSGSYFPFCNIGLGTHVVGCLTSGVYAGSCARDALTK